MEERLTAETQEVKMFFNSDLHLNFSLISIVSSKRTEPWNWAIVSPENIIYNTVYCLFNQGLPFT